MYRSDGTEIGVCLRSVLWDVGGVVRLVVVGAGGLWFTTTAHTSPARSCAPGTDLSVPVPTLRRGVERVDRVLSPVCSLSKSHCPVSSVGLETETSTGSTKGRRELPPSFSPL